jgi:hypothetical protein
MTWTVPKQLLALVPEVQALHNRQKNEFGNDTGTTFTDSGDGANRKLLASSLQTRATALVANCPQDGRANEVAWRMRYMGYALSGFPGDTGKAG